MCYYLCIPKNATERKISWFVRVRKSLRRYTERERERVIIEFEIGYCKGSVIDTLKLYLECRRVQTKSKGNDSILTTSDDFGIQQEVSETCDEK